MCWRCKGSIDAGDNYCRHCGRGQGSHLSWYYTHLGVIFLTVAAIGPFSLFLVWRSPRFNMAVRCVYTVLICAFSYFAWVKITELWQGMTSLLSLVAPV